MKTLAEILQTLDLIAQTAELVPGIQFPAAAVDAIVQIAQKTVQAHLAMTGQPLDLSKLHKIDPVP